MIARILVFWFILAAPVAALTVRVRSGEHADFSRLVFTLPVGVTWQLDPVAEGVELHVGRQDLKFDLRNVFDLIPRDRVRGVETTAPDTVLIRTGTHIVTQTDMLTNGELIIDFRTGPVPRAKPGSRALQPTPRTRQAVSIGAEHLPLFWNESEQEQAPDAPGSAPLDLPNIPEPDSRIVSIEKDLVHQLGRAATQGIIALKTPRLEDFVPQTVPAPNVPASHPPSKPSPNPPPDPAYQTQDHIAFRAETVIDRDMDGQVRHTGTTAAGKLCPPDSLFDVPAWTDDRPASSRIAEARRSLIGEFDVPDQTQVLQLARTYVSVGFGAEARQLLDTMGNPGKTRDALLFIADILDGAPPSSRSPFLQMSGCAGPVALWSFIAQPPAPSGTEVNYAALQRSFFALPPALRQIVGPILVEQLLAAGADGAAYSIRDSLARVTGEDQDALDLVDAQVSLHHEGPDAHGKLEGLVSDDRAYAVKALLLLVEDKLSHGQTIDEKTIGNAQALSFELAGTPEALHLIRAASLGLASGGDFRAAFAEIERWPNGQAPDLRAQTTAGIFALLADVPDDARFLTQYFAHEKIVVDASRDAKIRHALAQRLITLGYPGAATRLFKAAYPLAQNDLLLLARAALRAQDAAAALAYLKDIESDEAERLRALALSRVGNHSAARAAFTQVGEAAEAAQEAWRDGDWDFVQTHDEGARQAFARTFGAGASSHDQSDSQAGPLAQARDMIAKSQEERDLLSQVLGQLQPSTSGDATPSNAPAD